MLEQTQIEEETTAATSEAPRQARTSLCLQSNAPIAGKRTDAGRGVALSWRADLEARIETHQASGLSRNEATAAALHEMREAGLTRYVAGRMGPGALKKGRLARLHQRMRSLALCPPLFADARAATATSLTLFGLPAFDVFVNGPSGYLLRWWLHAYHLNPGDLGAGQPAVFACLYSYGRFELLAVPLLAGLLSGLVAPKNATRGVWNALMLLAIPLILWPGVVEALSYISDGGGWFFSTGVIGVIGIGYWAMLGTAGVRIGQWLREKQTARRSRLASEASAVSKAGMGRAHTRRISITPPLFRDAVPATITALPLFGLACWADNSMRAADLWEHLFQEDRWKHLANSVFQVVRSSEDAGFYRFELFVIPAVIGLLTGLLTRRNAALGVLNALALLAIPALLLPGMANASQFAGVIPAQLSLNWLPNMKPAVNGIAIWGLLGAGSAQTVQCLKGKAMAVWNRNRRYLGRFSAFPSA